MPELWRIPIEHLEAAQDDATVVAIQELERTGIDVITDGEIRRESYSNHFVAELDGIDLDHPAEIVDHRGNRTEVPRIVGPIRRRRSVEGRHLAFARRQSRQRLKVTVPGPFTLAQQACDEHYGSLEETAMAFAAAVNDELRELAKAGADVVQIDEPWLRNDPAAAERFGVAAIDRALEGVETTTALHMCFGYAALVPGEKPTAYTFLPQLADCVVDQISIEAAQPHLDLGVLRELSGKTVVLGVLDLGAPDVETPDTVAARIRDALGYLDPGQLVAAPDCGMKYLPRATAFAKLEALAAGAALVNLELA